MCSSDLPMSDAEYVPPAVWSWNKENGGQFAAINRPMAGVSCLRIVRGAEKKTGSALLLAAGCGLRFRLPIFFRRRFLITNHGSQGTNFEDRTLFTADDNRNRADDHGSLFW